MLKNYFVTALRNIRRNKLFSAINILGLVIGISASLVIYLVVHYNFTFDKFEKDRDRVYRVVSDYSAPDRIGHSRGTQSSLVTTAREGVTGLQEIIPFNYFRFQQLTIPGIANTKPAIFNNPQDVIFADTHYFNLISYQWLAGSPSTALRDMNKVVLTESRARNYFPGLKLTDIIGRRIDYQDSIHTTIAGIVADPGTGLHTDFRFSEFISLATVLDNPNLRKTFNWDDWNSMTSDHQLYLKLQKGVSPASVEASLKNVLVKYHPDQKNFTYRLQPLEDVHFNADYGLVVGSVVTRSTSYGLLLVAGILLLLACINFVNLTTAHASQRAKEIGIRKTMGSSRKQLVIQFLNETLLITVIATVLSLIFTPLLLQMFSGFIPNGLQFTFQGLLHQYDVLMFLVILILSVTLLAGFYPAVVLSSWLPVQVLKNQAKNDSGKGRKVWIRQTLTVSQFVIAQAFVIATLFVTKQIHFMLNKDLGFKKDAIVNFDTPDSDTSWSRRTVLLHQLQSMPGIKLASIASDVPSSGWTRSAGTLYKDGKIEIKFDVEMKFGDSNYLRLFQIPLLAGRMILPSDTVREVLVNETFLKMLHLKHPDEAIGKMVTWYYGQTTIAGVVKDFYVHPLNEGLKPVMFTFSTNDAKQMIVSLSPQTAGGDDWKNTIDKIGKAYKNIYPDDEFKYAFLDEYIASHYENEQKISSLLRWATGLTVFISCLGLLGLVIFTTHLRRKEIGIRKVLGASVSVIVATLSKDFLKLVCLAFVIASPIAWWSVHQWINKYAFRTSVSWWVFVASGILMISAAFITLSIQTIRAARANPVRSLRSE